MSRPARNVALAASGSALVILALFLRMVPNSLARPFILARIQPLLRDDSRATYLSLQSLAGRLILAVSLAAGAMITTDQGQMSHAEIRLLLGWYAGAGAVCLAALALTARRLPIERRG